MRPQLLALVFCCGLLAVALAGCGPGGEAGHQQPTAVVKVSEPVVREVTDFLGFTGRTDAVESVDVRSRVSGYLKDILFKPGAEVKTRQKLFQIDPRPYQADLDKAN